MGFDGTWKSAQPVLDTVLKDVGGYGYVCPQCGGEVVKRCKCFEAHSVCANGHKFRKENGAWEMSGEACA
jgi:hypothetical protein